MALKGSGRPVEERFLDHIDKISSEKGCWLWLAAKGRNGYGYFNPYKKQGYAHRFAWEMTKGPIPQGMTVHHLCRVRHCVNPDHLTLLTRSENASEARQVTHCIHGHEFTHENTYIGSAGKRQCRKCWSQRRTNGTRVPKESGWEYPKRQYKFL